jgi:hypothetical protein
MSAYHCTKCNKPHFNGDAVMDIHVSHALRGDALRELYPTDVLTIRKDIVDDYGCYLDTPVEEVLGWLKIVPPTDHDPNWLPPMPPTPTFKPVQLNGTCDNDHIQTGKAYLVYDGRFWRVGRASKQWYGWTFYVGSHSQQLNHVEAVYELIEGNDA